MTNNANILDKQSEISALGEKYNTYNEAIEGNLLSELSALAEAFKTDASHALETNRVLQIGIVGQIKRGKSSFLNSLFFDGKDVLPKAATPMTAALTKINYADAPSASVEFYSNSEWQKVVTQAQTISLANETYQADLAKYQIESRKKTGRQQGIRPPAMPQHSEEAESCKELCAMVEKNGLSVDDYLGQTIVLEKKNSNADLVNTLNEYVGAAGKYTPIVKSTELALNIEGLKGIQVVDTPGMNDPIISRGRRTQEFLGQCDVVFLLSYSSQFLDLQDMGLLAQSIPNKGIDDIVLVGSLFDSVLLDECHKYQSISEALPHLTQKLNDSAKANVAMVCEQSAQNNSGQSSLMKTLQKALPPIFISSRCLDLSRKAENLSEEEQHSLGLLNGMFEGFTWTPDTLKQIANFAKIEQKLTAVRSNKEHILADRFDNLMLGVQREIKQKLEQIKADVSSKRKMLLDGNVEQQEAQQQALVKRIESGKVLVSAVFEKYRLQAQKNLSIAEQSIQQDASRAKQVNSQTGSKQESYETSREVSNSSLLNPFSWGSTRTEYSTHTRTVNYTYANTQDAVNTLEEFAVETGQRLYDASLKAVNLDLFRDEIKKAVKDLFDFSDDSFDPESVLLPLNNAVERITIPAIQLDLDHHINTIRQQFSSNEVLGDEINALRTEQARVVVLLLNDIATELNRCKNGILSQLADEELKFVPNLTKDLIEKVAQLKRDLENSEQSLARYQEIISKVDQDLSELGGV